MARSVLCQFEYRKKVSGIVVSKEMLVSCSRAWQKYSKAMELKKKEDEMSKEKNKKMELDISTHLKRKNGKK